jgi:hypothetical protein
VTGSGLAVSPVLRLSGDPSCDDVHDRDAVKEAGCVGLFKARQQGIDMLSRKQTLRDEGIRRGGQSESVSLQDLEVRVGAHEWHGSPVSQSDFAHPTIESEPHVGLPAAHGTRVEKVHA